LVLRGLLLRKGRVEREEGRKEKREAKMEEKEKKYGKKEKEREGKRNLPPLKFRSGYATGHVK